MNPEEEQLQNIEEDEQDRITRLAADQHEAFAQDQEVGEKVSQLDQGPGETTEMGPKNVDKEGNLMLREDEIIGPTREKGEYEPKGYAPGSIQDPNVGSPLKPIADVVEPFAAGVHDWFADEVNSKMENAWGWEKGPIQRWPKSSNELSDATRDLTALLAPMIMYTKGAKGAAKRVHASGIAPARVQAIGNDPAFKLLANLGIDVGVGVHVDSTAHQQGEDHNLAGNFKEWWPQTYKWIPNWWATADSDSEDVKRHKNRQEGAGMNMAVELIGASARFVRAAHGAWQGAKWVPKNEKAGQFFANLQARYTDSAVRETFETLARSAEQRSKNLDDVGEFFLSKLEGSTIDQPLKGVHDIWDIAETGMRSVDEGDVASAMVGAARIKKNIGTQFGRLANFISPAAMKKAVDEGPDWLLDQVMKRINEAGKFDYITSEGVKLSDKEIKNATTELAEMLSSREAESGFIVKVLKQLDGVEGAEAIRTGAVQGALKKYMQGMYNLERFQADALVQSTSAGQISDFAESLLENYEGMASANLQEEIWDRVETLLNFKGLSDWTQQETFFNPTIFDRMKNVFKNKEDTLSEYMTREAGAREAARAQITSKSKQFIQTLKQVAKEKPNFLKPLYEMYDATNGEVNTMYKLNKQFMEEFVNVGKLVLDTNPDMPNRFVQAGWANVMNSTLSGFGTPIASAIGNFTGLMGKPAAMALGNVPNALRGDFYGLRKMWHGYSALTDTFEQARKYGHETFMKLSTEPEKYAELMRPELAMIRDNRMQAHMSYAESAMKEGNEGPMMLMQQLKQWEDLANSPVMRFSGNNMSAQDMFVQAFQAQVQAKFDAFDFVEGRLSMDEIVRDGLDNSELYKKAYETSYAKMFNKDGIITDPRVKYASKEISLQLDSGAASALNKLTQYSPIMRTVFMFPRSQGNMLTQFAKYNPAQPLIGQFVGDLQAFTMKNLEDYSGPEIMEALKNRGMGDIAPDQAMQKFIELRQEARGRWAMGTIGVMGAWNAFINGKITGDQNRDPALARQARQLGKPDRSYQLPTGHWISYEWAGPIADWMATTVNVLNNFDKLTEVQIEELGNKLAFIAGAAIKDKTAMANFASINDIFNGNEGAMNRYLAGTFNNAIPLAGQRGEWGRLFEHESREINRTVDGYLRNRNKFGDKFVPEDAGLPISTDWIYGKPVGGDPSFLTRVWNTYNKGAMISDNMGPEARFLDVVGFNSFPSFQTSPEGVEYTNTERAELYAEVGKNGFFLDTIKRVMKRVQKDGSLEQQANLREDWWNTSERIPADKFMGIHEELRYGLNIAVQQAHATLSTRDRIENEAYIVDINENRAATGQRPLSVQAENFLRNLPTR